MVRPPRSSSSFLHPHPHPHLLLLLLLLLTGPALVQAQTLPTGCGGLVVAEVVALDQPFSWNRYGALEPQGMIYALKRDVVNSADADGLPSPGEVQTLAPGQVSLRRDKRPRPLVLRVNAGQCLRLHFTNLLNPTREDEEQPATRHASIHVIGMQLLAIGDDGSFVGTNPNSTVGPGGTITYTLFAEREGGFLMHSMGAIVGGEGDGGSISAGLFGAVIVEPAGAEWYRSQVTRADLDLAMLPSPDKHPRIDYNAVYPAGHRYAGLPILEMLHNGEIVHSDLTALITGPGAGDFTTPLPTTGLYPERQKPFREFTIIFHDEIGAVQAFREFEDRVLEFTLHSVRDAFAINYGTGGIGAEVLANRFGVGPPWDCAECKYEEFFLTSWAVGDPAMVVDKPANHPCDQNGLTGCTPTPGPKATKAFYPDDPSNVYHSYLNDHVKFRNLHAGTDDHHIFHLHAHQWTHSPRNDRSSYLDSQSIGQGASFTYEITYDGGGNRNRTAGDSIFHCHFYPHFAQGMWSLWRVHDVLETGTEMAADGRPAVGARALPDNEIVRGTPIPAVVPIPTIAMAPLPGPVSLDNSGQIALPNPVTENPGYPFFIPGKAGRRPPHPPLDTIFDGGLPRHLVDSGTATSVQNRLDFHKRIDTLVPRFLAEAGEPVEQLAMDFHDNPAGYPTPTPKGGAGTFRVNKGGRVRGAPYADPCIDDQGNPVTRLRTYKAADIQLDVIFNKSGWHFPQQRMTVLHDDVLPTLQGTRTPEPLFIRAESGECVEFWLTNLAPNEYHLDDFQVRTPTDILGQHIHLVKFDVTSSDGAANGYNYEDGSFAGEEVQERLCAIRRVNAALCGESTDPEVACNFQVVSEKCPVPRLHPLFNDLGQNADCDHDPDWWGAQTTVQRWWADPIPIQGSTATRTLRTVFTHDHFGPSTHQQAGLYAGLIVEPDGTDWFHNERGFQLSVNNGPGWNQDGGPTSWQAVIEGTRVEDNFREFALQVQDFVLAYKAGGPVCPDPVTGFADFARAVNPPGRKLVGPPVLYENPANCPTNDGSLGPPRPCPEAVSADDPGMTSFNYRNEPLALRISTPADVQTPGRPGDLSFAYMTRRDRARPEFNVFPFAPHLPGVPYGPLTNGLRRGDPFTPLLRAYEGDRVIVRTFGGAHEEEHNFTIHAMKWLFEPEWSNSGWRNSQQYGISEWFDFVIPRMPSLKRGQFADFLYKPTAASEWQWNGAWGLVRLYRGPRGNSSHLTAASEAAGATTPEETPGTTTAPAPIDAEQAEDDADAVQPGDLEVLDDESLLVLIDQNPDAEAPEGAGVFAEVPLAEAEADGVVLSRDPASEAVPATSIGTTGAASSVFEAETAATSTGNIRIACPRDAPVRTYEVTAVAASEALLNDPLPTLVYNSRSTSVTTYAEPGGPVEPATRSGPLHDPTAILFVHDSDLTWVGGRPRLNLNVRREPLVLRANQGDCIKVKLRNALPGSYADQPGWNAMPMIIEGFNANDVRPSKHVSLHPQLVYYDVRRGDGSNAGLNPKVYHRQTVAPGERKTFYWYAGDATANRSQLSFASVEFGATGLSSADPIKHTNKGAVGALIIEPQGSSWTFDTTPEAIPFQTVRPVRTTRASATVTTPTSSFKEFVLIVQNDVNLRYENGDPVESLDVNEDPTESAQKAVNYKTEPIWFRTGKAPDTPMGDRGDFPDYHLVLSNAWIGNLDPETPVFEATPNRATRVRLINPGGHTQAHVFDLHGHLWEELPYINNSRNLGSNPGSEWQGARGGHGPTNHHEAILKNGAGGKAAPAGDYLYREYAGWLLDDGIWGILRVGS